ncbi:histone-fold-containing protein [Dactylonectria estremocensis]|uniref:DNA polymerase epsilon subunit D n=1 Tax=Dactylonectria estremocensis TaxID=1079267 RepID=A0A9P9ED78_9HYPO|nr:histone-fold-containing protein [Dactylonectria estremocensis]
MPPRKSTSRKSDVSTARTVPVIDAEPKEPTPASAADESAVADAEESSGTPSAEKKDKDKEKDKDKDRNEAIAIEDLTLPKSIITRLAKGVLPANTQIQANAILAMSNSATVFISYLASHANEITVTAGKKTVTPADVFKALEDTEFSFLRAPLEAEFAKFNAIRTEKRTSYRQKVRAKKSDDPDTSMADTSQADTTLASEASGPRSTKRARVDPSAATADVEDDAETEDEEPVPEDDDDDDDVVDDEQEEDDGEGGASGNETQDALEEKEARDDADEALDGDESD